MSATQLIRGEVEVRDGQRMGEPPSPVRPAPIGYDLSHNRQPELTSVAWVARGDLTWDEWLRHGRRLGVAGRNAAWWIGDWVRYGTARYGRKYELATRVTGYEHQTLLNMVYVATRFEISRRRENLSWSHHAELAALDVVEQERWLDRAAEERLTIRCLRRELIAAREFVEALAASHGRRPNQERWEPPMPHPNAPQAARGGRPAAEPKVMTCPRCGHHFLETVPAADVVSTEESPG